MYRKKLGYPQRILLNQYNNCVERTKKKVDLKDCNALIRFMLEESSIVQSDGSVSYQRTADAINLINKKLCPGQWCTRSHCDKFSTHHAWTSFNKAVRKFTWMWKGMFQQNMANKELRIHPTQNQSNSTNGYSRITQKRVTLS